MRPYLSIVVTLAGVVAGCTPMQKTEHAGSEDTAGFVDVTADAGLVTEQARGAGWADYNGDGCIDLLVTQAAGARLFRNDCAGGFADVSRQAGISGPIGGFAIAWADYDGDGNIDAYIASADTANVLYRNRGNGTFIDVAESSGVADSRSSAGASWGDFDADGDLDLFVANRFYPTPESEITDRLYRNSGDGSFTDVGPQSGVAVADRKTFMGAWFDYDRNGTLDLYLAVDFGDDRLYRNDGRGRFTDVSGGAGVIGPAHAMGLAVGDINGDGCPDLVSTNNTRGEPENREHGPSTLYQNNCDGTFSDQTRRWGIEDRGTVDWGVHLVDWDNDGDEDLSIVAGGMLEDGEKETNILYENRGGRLLDVTRHLGSEVNGAAFGSAWADYDNDGDLDWFIANSKTNSVLLENRAAHGHYLKVRLKGHDRNRAGVGARVELTAAGRTQVRTLQAGIGYASSQELAAHFGLGDAKRVERLKVVWPVAGVTELQGLEVDQTVVVRSPGGGHM